MLAELCPTNLHNLGQAVSLPVEGGCKATPKTMGTNPTSPASSSPLPSPPHHHSAGNAHNPEQIRPQAGVHRPISGPFSRVHSYTHRNPPMVPTKQNP